MRRPLDEEFQRWFTQANDEFQDADDLRKRKRFYLALFHFLWTGWRHSTRHSPR